MKLDKSNKLKAGLVIAISILIVKLFVIQIVDEKYKIDASNNSMSYAIIYPPRGIIDDRNGKILVGNKIAYDLLVTPKEVEKFDTAALASALNVDEAFIREKMDESTTSDRHVTQVVRYMYQNLNKNLTLSDISREVELSKSYLNAIFKAQTGKSPVEFFIHLKMQEACKLLKSGQMYVYEAAAALGYEDQYYFSRIFKKVVGVSPRDYQNGDYFYPE